MKEEQIKEFLDEGKKLLGIDCSALIGLVSDIAWKANRQGFEEAKNHLCNFAPDGDN